MSRDFKSCWPLEPGEPTITLFELWGTDGREPYLIGVDSTSYNFRLEPGLLILKREYVPASKPEFVNEARLPNDV